MIIITLSSTKASRVTDAAVERMKSLSSLTRVKAMINSGVNSYGKLAPI